MSQDQKTAEKIIQNAKPECLACKNFGTNVCPAFQQALRDNQVQAKTLSVAIMTHQEGKDLRDCDNAPTV